MGVDVAGFMCQKFFRFAAHLLSERISAASPRSLSLATAIGTQRTAPRASYEGLALCGVRSGGPVF